MNFFKSNPTIPKHHQLMPTDDGSFTFKSLNYQENCHSTNGAIEETIYNYIDSCQVNKLDLPETHIFETGLGLGLGPMLSFLQAKIQNKKIHFYSCEIQEDLIVWLKQNSSSKINEVFPFSKLEKVHDKYYYAEGKHGSLTVFCGDVLENKNLIKSKTSNNIHKIFQDAFSPKTNPELWTLDWFKFLRELSSNDCMLTTYSASHGFRKNLQAAGFFVYNKKGFGQKRSMTVASTNALTDPSINCIYCP